MPGHEPRFWVGVVETETLEQSARAVHAAWVHRRVVMAPGASMQYAHLWLTVEGYTSRSPTYIQFATPPPHTHTPHTRALTKLHTRQTESTSSDRKAPIAMNSCQTKPRQEAASSPTNFTSLQCLGKHCNRDIEVAGTRNP